MSYLGGGTRCCHIPVVEYKQAPSMDELYLAYFGRPRLTDADAQALLNKAAADLEKIGLEQKITHLEIAVKNLDISVQSLQRRVHAPRPRQWWQ